METENDKNHLEKQEEVKEGIIEINNATPHPETPKETETPKREHVESENDENKEEEEANDSKIEESPPPDFDKASEEIDEFISALSLPSKDDQLQSGLPDVPEVFENFAFLAEANIANYECGQEEYPSFLKSVEIISNLSKALGKFSTERKYDNAMNRISGILHRAMCYLEDEFRSVLEDPKFVHNLDHGNDNQDPEESPDQKSPKEEISSGNNSFPGYTEEAITKLNTLRYVMGKAGYEAECYQSYVVSRRTILEETLRKLGFEKLSLDEIQKMQWESLESEIVTWNNTFKEFFSLHFINERKLSEAIFSDDKSLSDSLFSSIALSMTIQLLNFAEAVAITKSSSQKLFKFIDIYEALRDAISTMDSLFPEETANELKAEASLIRTKLGEAMVSIFGELEISIKADIGKNNVPGGAVHPLTRYTLNYLKYACEYTETLEQVFREHQKGDTGYSNENNHEKNIKSPFAEEISKVMDLLDANLDSKSKLYKDNALSSIFMMNNGRYVLQKIKGSPGIHGLMGDTWSRKRSSDLRNYHKTYQRETWNRLLNCLSTEGLSVHGKVNKPVLKEKFKSFNAMFDEIHKTQSGWVVSDEQLQSELRVSISAIVIPAYRSFLARYSQTFTAGRQTEKYVKYQPEDIETYIDELFDGNTTPTGRRRA